MAGAVPVVLAGQVDRNFAQMRFLAQKAVADQTVEVEGRGCACMGLRGQHFGQVHDHPRHVLRDTVGRLNAGPFGQVDHDGQFGLVVEGQKLDGHVLRVKRAQRSERQHHSHQQEHPGPRLGFQQRSGDSGEERPKAPAGMATIGVVMGMRAHVCLARNLDHQPGCDDHRHEEGKDHRRRGIRRDRRHVRAHQARDEQHWQQRRNNSQRGDNGRIADLCHCIHGRLGAGTTVLHPPVPGDVFDDHDGVIDQNPDGKDQREQRHAVECVAHDPGGKERQQNGHRDHDGHHDRLTPANGEKDQRHDRRRGQTKVEQQFIGLFIGRLAIVTGHGQRHALWHQTTFGRLDPVQDSLCDVNRIGPGALGHGQRDRRRAVDTVGVTGDLRHDPVGTVGDKGHIRHIRDIDRAPVACGQHKARHLRRGGQSLTRDQVNLFAAVTQFARGQSLVGLGDLGGQLLQRHAVQCQPLGIWCDTDHFLRVADKIGQANVVGLGHFGLQFAGDPGQVIGRGRAAWGRRQRQRQDRDIVDTASDHQRFRDAKRQAVHICAQLVMHPQDRVFGAGADHKARRHHRGIVAGLGIDMLDRVDALDQHLQRFGHEFHAVFGPQAGGLHMDIDQGNRDLRLFLAREADQRDQTDRDGGQNEKRRKRAGDECLGQATGQAKALWPRGVVHSEAPVSTSPVCRPDRISTITAPSTSWRCPATTERSPPSVATKSRPCRVIIAASGTRIARRSATGRRTSTRASTKRSDRSVTSTSAMTRPFSIRG